MGLLSDYDKGFGFSSKKMSIQMGLGHWKIAPTIKVRSASAVASAVGGSVGERIFYIISLYCFSIIMAYYVT